MNRYEALRKVSLLRRIIPDNGASVAEAAVAARMADDLMRRYVGDIVEPRVAPVAIKAPEVSTEPWARLLDEFGFQLKTFNGRCSAAMSRTCRLLVRAEDRRWEIQQSSPTGWKITTRGVGLSTLREYLTRNTARRYTFMSA